MKPIQTTFDIVVPVFNSLSSVKNCLQTVLKYSSLPFRLILVNDCSDVFTSEFLQKVAEADPRVRLLENQKNLGFLKTANRGLQFSIESTDYRASHILLLNSDVMVTPNYLEAFANCFASDNLIAVACPLSNAAENFSLPLSQGDDFLSTAGKVFEHTKPRYPDITTAIGFCMAFRRETIEELGYFDEAFERGYAEDTDYHFRVITTGKRVVLVDNCFVYHEGGASFQQEKDLLISQNRKLFDARWSSIYRKEILQHTIQAPLENVISSLKGISAAEITYDVVFFLPISALSGGIIVVYEIIQRLILMGMKATAVILESEREIPTPLSFAPFFHPEGSNTRLPKSKIYVASHFRTLPHCFSAQKSSPDAEIVYLIQGYEGWFPNSVLDYVTAGYPAVENRIVVSSWLSKMLKRWNCDSTIIPNGVDTNFFRPGDRFLAGGQKDPLRVLLFLRDDPQRSLVFGTELIRRLEANLDFEIWGIGEASLNPELEPLLDRALGQVDRRGLANALKQVDIFVDTSMMQGFGLLGLEAMSAGVATVLSETGGVLEYAKAENSILCQPGSVEALEAGLLELAGDREKLKRLKANGRQTALELDWDRSIRHYYNYFANLLEKSGRTAVPGPRENYLLTLVERQQRISHVLREAEEIFKEELVALVPRDRDNNGFEFLKARLPAESVEFLMESDEGHLLVELYETAKQALLRKEERLEIVREKSGLPPETSLLEKVIDATQSIK